MIFLTVGAQMPFDRLVRSFDRWAGQNQITDCVAQVGESSYKASNIECVKHLPPTEYEQTIRESTLVVAHAGMGTILTAMRMRKPILIFPRRGDLQETRNNHQVSTVKYFSGLEGIYTADSEKQLHEHLDKLKTPTPTEEISAYASDQLVATVNGFLEEKDRTPRSLMRRVVRICS